MKNNLVLLLLLFSLLSPAQGLTAEVRVAVASNFVNTLRALSKEFTASSGHSVLTSFGSTGKLYAQIINGAPFDILMSADEQRPFLLEEK